MPTVVWFWFRVLFLVPKVVGSLSRTPSRRLVLKGLRFQVLSVLPMLQ